MYVHVCLLEQVFSNSVDIWSGWCFLPLPARHQEHSFGGDSRRDLHCQMTPEHGNLVTKLPQLRTSKRFPRFHNIKINKILHTKAEWWLNYFLNVIKYKLSTNLLSLYLSYTTALIFFLVIVICPLVLSIMTYSHTGDMIFSFSISAWSEWGSWEFNMWPGPSQSDHFIFWTW